MDCVLIAFLCRARYEHWKIAKEGEPPAEIGDIVTAINGQTIRSLADYYAIMDSITSVNSLKVTIKDVRSQREVDWNAVPVLVPHQPASEKSSC